MNTNDTRKKIDLIESNSTGNVKVSATANIILDSPEIINDEILITSDNGDGEKSLIGSGVSITNVNNNNFTATTDPTVNDGTSAGYNFGSFWYNSISNILFICEDPDYTAPVAASFTGQVAGMTTDVTIVADNVGTIGNSASLSFDGVDDIATAISDWNTANPANTITLTFGDDTQIPDNLEVISLAGGVNEAFNAVWEPVGSSSVTVDTRANIDALPRVAGSLYYSTDEDEFLVDNGTSLFQSSIYYDTKANLDDLTRVAGRIVYATDLNTFFGDNGTVLAELGSGGGGVDVYLNEKFEVNSVSSFSTGNNVTFLGGGSIAGALVDETSAPIQGLRSIKYTQASGSLNDYFAFSSVSIGEQQQGKVNTFIHYSKYSGDTGDVQIVVWDVTNGQNLLSNQFVESSTIAKRYELKYFVPTNCTQIRIGYQVVVENIGAILIFDLLELNSNPFAEMNILDSRMLTAVASGTNDGAVLDTTPGSTYSRVLTTVTVTTPTPHGLLVGHTVSLDFTSGAAVDIITQVTAVLSPTQFTVTHGTSGTTSGNVSLVTVLVVPGSTLNNVHSVIRVSSGVFDINFEQQMESLNYIVTGSGWDTSAMLGHEPDENTLVKTTVRVYAVSGSLNSRGFAFVVHLKIPENLAIISNGSLGANWSDTGGTILLDASITPPTKGTVVIDRILYKKSGDTGMFRYEYQQSSAGTTGSGQYIYTLPMGLEFSDDVTLANSAMTSQSSHAGTSTAKLKGVGHVSVVGSSGGETEVFPISATQFKVLTKSLYTTANVQSSSTFSYASPTLNFCFEFEARIKGWDIENSVSMISPMIRTASFIYQTASAVDGGAFTSGSQITIPLNVHTGDTDFARLASKQVTFSPGTYEFTGLITGYRCTAFHSILRNVTNNTDIAIGNPEHSPNTASNDVRTSELPPTKVTFTVPTVVELRGQCALTRAGDGLGLAGNLSYVNNYAWVTANKIK